MRKLILLSLLFCLSATVYVSAQSKPTQKELLEPTYNNSKTLINTGKYQFVGDAVYNDVTREMLDKAINSLSINKSEASGEIVSLSTEKKNIKVKGAIE